MNKEPTKTDAQIQTGQRDKERYELDEVQEHFRTSNEPLINGIPMSIYFKQQEKKSEQ